MPRFDGTGPMGNGSMTGGGFGYCAGEERLMGRGGRYFSRRGCGRGFGRGLARGYGRAYVANEPITKEEEKAYIESDIKALEQELENLKKQLKEVSK